MINYLNAEVVEEQIIEIVQEETEEIMNLDLGCGPGDCSPVNLCNPDD